MFEIVRMYTHTTLVYVFQVTSLSRADLSKAVAPTIKNDLADCTSLTTLSHSNPLNQPVPGYM